jgi:hypothetical protein
MKTITAIQRLVVIGLFGLGSVTKAEIKIEAWRFDTGASSALPEVAPNPAASCQAVVVPGPFASGWVESSPVFGGARGVWDLGSTGTITCQGLSGLLGGSGQERVFTVRIKQYYDGGIYGESTGISVPGATVVSSNLSVVATAFIGDWLVQEVRWKVPAGVTSDALQIVGAPYGSLVDEVSVETSALAVTQPPVLSIRQVSGGDKQIEISWPAAHGGMVLESNPNPHDSAGWAMVEAAVQTNNGTAFVVVEGSATSRFFRLKQP